jgi:Phage integrase family
VNRELSAVGAFYTYAARDGVDVGGLLTSWQVGGGRGGRKPFLHHISKSAPRSRRVIALKAPKKLPRVLTPIEVQAVLDGCERLRDRLLFAVLYDTGMRIGEALGLRHNDIAAAEREVTVRRRDNANGPTLAVAHGGDPAAARWRRHRGGRSSARTRARGHDDRDLRAPHRGRTRGGHGTGRLVHQGTGAVVTAPSPKPAGSSRLLGKLMAAVRSEFRNREYLQRSLCR